MTTTITCSRTTRTAPGTNEALANYLFKNAAVSFDAKQYSDALALLLEARDRNPKRSGLSKIVEKVADKLIAQRVDEKNFEAARTYLQLVRDKFPEEKLPAVERWEQRFAAEAQTKLSEAATLKEAEKYREAQAAVRSALAIWPTLGGGREMSSEIQQKFPFVVVGVLSPAALGPLDRLDDWATHRSRRLLERTLCELDGYTTDGGRYRSGLGEIVRDPFGLKLSLVLRDGKSGGAGVLSGLEVSRLLMAMSDRQNPLFRPGWDELFGGVTVKDVYTVDIDLRRAQLRPERILEVALPHIVTGTAGRDRPAVSARADHAGRRSFHRQRFVPWRPQRAATRDRRARIFPTPARRCGL